MNKVVLISLLILCVSSKASSQDQKQQIASRNAQRMKDSLGLNKQQYNQIFAVNMKLANEQHSVFKSAIPRDSVGRRLQRIENSRDSLYKRHLTDAQYLIYTHKKRYLITN